MKRLIVLASIVFFVLSGTCFADVTQRANFPFQSGTSYAQTPVISGFIAGETVYVVSGGYHQADMVAETGVTIWEISSQLNAAGAINMNSLFSYGIGLGGYTTGVTACPSSPVLVDNAAGGQSVFYVANFSDQATLDTVAVTGFVLFCASTDSSGTDVVPIVVESMVTGEGVWGPLAWTDQGWRGGTTSGNSLFSAP